MDFNVRESIAILSLGVCDDGSDGLPATLTAYVYDRATQTSLARLEFTPEDPGELIGGSRLKELDDPLALPAGFRGSIVAEGYGAGDLLPNGGAIPITWTTDDGGCLIEFVGGGRWGDAGSYPATVDPGPANRYAAGTFEFEPFDGPVLLPPTPPSGLTIAAGDGEVLLGWSASAGQNPAVSYRVFRSVDGAAFEEIAQPTATEYRDDDVTNGVDVCYRVRAVAADDQESDDSPTACATPGAVVEGRHIAYRTPTATLGNLDSPDAFGLDFRVDADVLVTRLGVFDDGGDGLVGELRVILYDRDTQAVVAEQAFSAGDPGGLIGGSRFLDLDDPVDLLAGFQGSIVAEGFSAADRVGVNVGTTIDPGPCSLSFRRSRRDVAGAFPFVETAGTAAYAAGTFEYEDRDTLPPSAGAIAYVVPEGTLGNQAFAGSLGMDFDVEEGILVERLGVFDDGSDGLNLPLTAHVYDRVMQEELARLEFSPDDPGTLIGGSRFKDLDPPLALPAGFQGTMVAAGYGVGEQLANTGGPGNDFGLTTDSAGCAIRFVGTSRYGDAATPGSFPDVVDGGPPNQFAAGTFEFSRGGQIPERFVRGDSDSNSRVELTDAVQILNFLFTGGGTPPCLDAADADDSGDLAVTDAVRVLGWLFQGGIDPAPPTPTTGLYLATDCGMDGTVDGLNCGDLADTCE